MCSWYDKLNVGPLVVSITIPTENYDLNFWLLRSMASIITRRHRFRSRSIFLMRRNFVTRILCLDVFHQANLHTQLSQYFLFHIPKKHNFILIIYRNIPKYQITPSIQIKKNLNQTFPDFQFKTRVICLYLIIEFRRYKFTSVECKGCVFIKMLIWALLRGFRYFAIGCAHALCATSRFMPYG